MPSIKVVPVVDRAVRWLCVRAYHGHAKGCPNWNRKDGCPPKAPLLDQLINLSAPVYAVYNRFNLAAHVAAMKGEHPDWSYPQLACCLYWQSRARKRLHIELDAFANSTEAKQLGTTQCLSCPEANGVDVTQTMASVGVTLEWPPTQFAYQVALVGRRVHPNSPDLRRGSPGLQAGEEAPLSVGC